MRNIVSLLFLSILVHSCFFFFHIGVKLIFYSSLQMKQTGKRKRDMDKLDFVFSFHQEKNVSTACISHLTRIAMNDATPPEVIVSCICDSLEQGPDRQEPLPAIYLMDSILKVRVSIDKPAESRHVSLLKNFFQKRIPKTISLVCTHCDSPTR